MPHLNAVFRASDGRSACYFLVVLAIRVLLDVLAVGAFAGLRLAVLGVALLRLPAVAVFAAGFLALLATAACLGSSKVMR